MFRSDWQMFIIANASSSVGHFTYLTFLARLLKCEELTKPIHNGSLTLMLSLN